VTTKELKNIIDTIIAEAFDTVQKMYSNKEVAHEIGNTSVAQIFPQYSTCRNYSAANITRVSEQELRYAFVNVLQKHCAGGKMFFSIETPTEGSYKFPKKDMPKIMKTGGQSGNFDLVIHDEEFNRICLIEFKCNYPELNAFRKDFLKLANPKEDRDEKEVLRYFIHLIVNYEKTKLTNRLKAVSKLIGEGLNKNVNYVLYSLCRDNKNDNTNIANDFSSDGEIGANADIKGFSLHWFDEKTKTII